MIFQANKCVCHGKPKVKKAQSHAGNAGWYVECSCGRRTEDAYISKDEAIAHWNDMIMREKGTVK